MTDDMETRHVEWEQVGDLSAYLMHLAEATPHFEDATPEDKATALRIDAALMEQQRPHLDEDGYPEEASSVLDVTLDVSDWAFMERWFANPERMGKWVMESIGTHVETVR